MSTVTRRITMLLGLALVAAAFAAPAASASTIEVRNADTEELCSSTEGGGCLLQMKSDDNTGIGPWMRCQVSLNLRVSGDGSAMIEDQVLTGPTCAVTPCDSWIGALGYDSSSEPNPGRAAFTFCLYGTSKNYFDVFPEISFVNGGDLSMKFVEKGIIEQGSVWEQTEGDQIEIALVE